MMIHGDKLLYDIFKHEKAYIIIKFCSTGQNIDS